MADASAAATKPTIAFFGATGGCACAALANALKNGYTCRALARTPSKLQDLLKAKNVSEQLIASNLSIIEGDVKDVSAVKEAVGHKGQVVDIIISGIGMNVIQLRFSLIRPFGSPDPSICTTATATIIRAVSELNPVKKPLFATISTTGISKGPRDVTLLFDFIYKWLAAVPHEDKRSMEELLDETGSAPSERKIFQDIVIVKASWLTDGPELGEQKIRVGTEDKPAIGYTISRNDVGGWIFRELLNGNWGKYAGGKITITY